MFSNPVLLIDKNFNCAYCNKKNFCKLGSSLAGCFQKSITLESDRVENTFMVYKSRHYCARISPISEDLFLCELFSSDDAIEISKYTDLYMEAERVIASSDRNIIDALNKLDKIEKSFFDIEPAENFENILTLGKPLISIKKTITNIRMYINMHVNNSNKTVIDIKEMILDFQRFFNTELHSIGRSINIIDSEDTFFVSVDKRYAISAILNVFQNAVFYSPRDSVPVVSLYKEKSQGMVVIQIRNDTSTYGKRKSKLEDDQGGLGFAIIKRFIEDAEGEIDFENTPGNFVVRIKLPEYRFELPYQFSNIEKLQYTDTDLRMIHIFAQEIVFTHKLT